MPVLEKVLCNTPGGDRNGITLGLYNRNINFFIGATSASYPVIDGQWSNIYPDTEWLEWSGRDMIHTAAHATSDSVLETGPYVFSRQSA